MKPIGRPIRITLIILVWLVLFVVMYPKSPHYDMLEYSSFLSYLNQDEVKSIFYVEPSGYAIINLKPYEKPFKVNIESDLSFKDIMAKHLQHNDELHFVIGNYNKQFDIVQYILLGFSFSFIIYWGSYAIERSIERKQAQPKYRHHKNDVKITFADVVGLEKQIEDISDVVKFLKEPQRYHEMGATLPKGILLYGPPGVGKTHIARAIAGEADVPFFHVSASELQSKWVGESEANIRRLFKAAKKHSPSVIYIDELDSIAVERFSDNSDHNMLGVINQLLACMDGFSKDTNVMVIASTNHIEALDRAILRPGRFDRKILIHSPDKEARKKLIEYYAKGKKLANPVSVEKLLSISAGLTGADIKTIMNEAALLSVRLGQDSITEEVILEAFRKVALGSMHTNSPIPKEKLKMIAIHEAGHAVVSHDMGRGTSEISIIARGNAAGYNLRSAENLANDTFIELQKEVCILLGGRAAEEVFYEQNVTLGASDDLRRATNIIKDMYLRFAYPEMTGNSLLVMTEDAWFNQKLIDENYEKMDCYMKTQYGKTKEIIAKEKNKVVALSNLLLDKETLAEDEIVAFFEKQ